MYREHPHDRRDTGLTHGVLVDRARGGGWVGPGEYDFKEASVSMWEHGTLVWSIPSNLSSWEEYSLDKKRNVSRVSPE